ncbi:Mov34/MPN/PAD-1 family protein [Chitinispirillales bacterium ANBcel5]|uniref:Mov34/MPN/PAD-1 family protein n=1 Tax=Cellulosispirillum alkaliphilum TaxID=3039283 RepID=UPI002A576016|nr:Mov34/MPN/PAD-1 family protein [Chitinispirillales bacterium ANBcel5]
MWLTLYKGIKINSKSPSFMIFSKKTAKMILSFQQNRNFDNEAGGLLIGYLRGRHFDVRYITTPQIGDIRRPFYFERKDPRHIQILNRLKLASKGKLTYLGEWHTHPEDVPVPSTHIDLKEWERIKRSRNYPIVFIIIGRKSYYTTIL